MLPSMSPPAGSTDADRGRLHRSAHVGDRSPRWSKERASSSRAPSRSRPDALSSSMPRMRASGSATTAATPILSRASWRGVGPRTSIGTYPARSRWPSDSRSSAAYSWILSASLFSSGTRVDLPCRCRPCPAFRAAGTRALLRRTLRLWHRALASRTLRDLIRLPLRFSGERRFLRAGEAPPEGATGSASRKAWTAPGLTLFRRPPRAKATRRPS